MPSKPVNTSPVSGYGDDLAHHAKLMGSGNPASGKYHLKLLRRLKEIGLLAHTAEYLAATKRASIVIGTDGQPLHIIFNSSGSEGSPVHINVRAETVNCQNQEQLEMDAAQQQVQFYGRELEPPSTKNVVAMIAQ